VVKWAALEAPHPLHLATSDNLIPGPFEGPAAVVFPGPAFRRPIQPAPLS